MPLVDRLRSTGGLRLELHELGETVGPKHCFGEDSVAVTCCAFEEICKTVGLSCHCIGVLSDAVS